MDNKNVTLQQFLLAFHKGDEQATVYTRLFDDKKRKGIEGINSQMQIKDIDKHESKLRELNDKGMGAFLVINGGGQSNNDITNITAQFVDMDNMSFEEQWERINSFYLMPSIIIKSANGYHAYWLIDYGKISQFTNLQVKLAEHLGGDTAVKNLSRVMRLPNFYHNKGEPVMVECVKFEPTLRYTQEEISEQLRFYDAVSEGKIVEGSRNSEIFKLAASCNRKGLSKAQTLYQCIEHNEKNCNPPLSEDEIKRTVHNAF